MSHRQAWPKRTVGTNGRPSAPFAMRRIKSSLLTAGADGVHADQALPSMSRLSEAALSEEGTYKAAAAAAAASTRPQHATVPEAYVSMARASLLEKVGRVPWGQHMTRVLVWLHRWSRHKVSGCAGGKGMECTTPNKSLYGCTGTKVMKRTVDKGCSAGIVQARCVQNREAHKVKILLPYLRGFLCQRLKQLGLRVWVVDGLGSQDERGSPESGCRQGTSAERAGTAGLIVLLQGRGK
eukprot:scaffold60803_cov20-Tisochrysis_lutea.AAC.3